MHKYEIIIYWSDEDEAFVAEVPDLPGCTVHGDTQEDALASCRQAVGLWLDTVRELGRGVSEEPVILTVADRAGHLKGRLELPGVDEDPRRRMIRERNWRP